MGSNSCTETFYNCSELDKKNIFIKKKNNNNRLLTFVHHWNYIQEYQPEQKF